jgi:hypothetical protein
VAAPTAEAERNVSSSPVSEAAFGGTPSGRRFCVPGIAPGHGSSPTPPEPAPRRPHNGEVQSNVVGILDGTDRGETEAEAVAGHQVDCLGVAYAGGNQVHGLTPQGMLQSVAASSRRCPMTQCGKRSPLAEPPVKYSQA